MNDQQKMMEAMRAAVADNLAECCKELIERERTGILRAGKIRAIVNTLQPIEGSFGRRLRMVEYEIAQQAIEFVFAKSAVGNGITHYKKGEEND